MASPQEQVIDDFYAAVFGGDIDRALDMCSSDAEYHIVTGGPASGRHSMREYVTEILPNAMAEMPGYAVEKLQRETHDDLVVARLRSTHGSGVMVFRVVGERLTDLWVINSLGRDATGWF